MLASRQTPLLVGTMFCVLSFKDLTHRFLLTCGLYILSLFQRYQYAEACQVDLKLQSVEQDFISKNSVGEEVLSRMKSASDWRRGLLLSA